MEKKDSIDNYLQVIVDSVNGKQEQFDNVIFTEQGVLTFKPYVEENTPNPFYNDIQETAFIHDMESMIKDRMEHCITDLEKHLSDKNIWISRDTIAWENGHFGKPTYKAMQEFLDANYLSFAEAGYNLAIMAQQVVRHMMFVERNRLEYPLGLAYSIETIFDVCSEMMLVLDPSDDINKVCKGIEEDED